MHSANDGHDNDAIYSRFKIGDQIAFQPNITKIDLKLGITTDFATSVICEVMAVMFTSNSVLYTIAPFIDNKHGFYYAYPFCDVDSVFVCPLENQQKEPHVEPPVAVATSTLNATNIHHLKIVKNDKPT